MRAVDDGEREKAGDLSFSVTLPIIPRAFIFPLPSFTKRPMERREVNFRAFDPYLEANVC